MCFFPLARGLRLHCAALHPLTGPAAFVAHGFSAWRLPLAASTTFLRTAPDFFLFQSSLADDLTLDTFVLICSPRLRDRQHAAADPLVLRATIR
ncbi:hypothetical protein CEP53_012778 [Fusarium sp. AF-6]|nr:hypothetical protein CEP53_012778 [Fusarium sp. AF-6]